MSWDLNKGSIPYIIIIIIIYLFKERPIMTVFMSLSGQADTNRSTSMFRGGEEAVPLWYCEVIENLNWYSFVWPY